MAEPIDQVPRKLSYLKAHPDHRISGPCEHDPRFRVIAPDFELAALTLAELLDRAERLDRGARQGRKDDAAAGQVDAGADDAYSGKGEQ